MPDHTEIMHMLSMVRFGSVIHAGRMPNSASRIISTIPYCEFSSQRQIITTTVVIVTFGRK